VCTCANMFPYSLPPGNNPIAVNKYYYYIIIIIIPLTGLRNTEKATLLKVRYIHNENEMTILKLYILWLCGDINVRHQINYYYNYYYLFLIISARNICIITEYFKSTFLKFTDSAVSTNT